MASKAAIAYQRAIEFLLERGAKVCLFRTPVTATYVATEKLIADSRYEEFDRYIKELSRSLSVRFVDFRELPFEFDDSKFFNQDHMNDQAAIIVWPLVAGEAFTSDMETMVQQIVSGGAGTQRARWARSRGIAAAGRRVSGRRCA